MELTPITLVAAIRQLRLIWRIVSIHAQVHS